MWRRGLEGGQPGDKPGGKSTAVFQVRSGVYALGPSYETGTVVGTGNGTEVVSTLMNPRE